MRDEPLALRVARRNARKTQDAPHQLAGLNLLTVQLKGCNILPALVDIGVCNEFAVVEYWPRVEETREHAAPGTYRLES